MNTIYGEGYVADRFKPTRLTVPQLEQMLAYCHDRENSGRYYGNKAQFWKRHNGIVSWLQEQIDTHSNGGNLRTSGRRAKGMGEK